MDFTGLPVYVDPEGPHLETSPRPPGGGGGGGGGAGTGASCLELGVADMI